MSKSNNDCIIVHLVFQTICIRVCKNENEEWACKLLTSLRVFCSYLWSGLIVIVGIYLNVYSRNQTVFNAKIVSLTQSLFNSRWWPRLFSAPTIRTLPV